jgi:hypothetical protein
MALATVESFKKPRPKNALQLFPDFDGTVHPACLHRQRAGSHSCPCAGPQSIQQLRVESVSRSTAFGN